MVSGSIANNHREGLEARVRQLVTVLGRRSPGIVCVDGPSQSARSALVTAALAFVAGDFGGPHFVDLAGLNPEEALIRLASVVRRLPARRRPNAEDPPVWLPEMLVVNNADLLAGAESRITDLARLDGVTIIASSATRLGAPLLASVHQPDPGLGTQPTHAVREGQSADGRDARQFATRARTAAMHRAAGRDEMAIALLDSSYPESLVALRELETTDPPLAARLAVDLLPEAELRGDEGILVPVVERLLARPGIPDDVLRDGLVWLALLDSLAPDAVHRVPRILQRLDAGLALAQRSLPQDRLLPLMVEVLTLGVLHDFDRAAKAAAEGAAITRSAGMEGWRARFEAGTATIQHVLGDQPGATRSAMAAWDRATASGDSKATVYATLVLARLPSATATGHGGIPALLRALNLCRSLHDRRLESYTLVLLATHALRGGTPHSATQWLVERYQLAARYRSWNALVPHIVLTMGLSSRLGQAGLTARLHGSLLQWSELALAALPGLLQEDYHHSVERARATLGPARFEQLALDGTRLTLESAATEAIDYVLLVADPSIQSHPLRKPGAMLTTREREVLRLLVAGQQNREIAARLVVSVKTVMHHTSAIYRKLGVRGRAEAAAAAVRLGFDPGV